MEYLSPRDAVGHGTHTASTVASNFVNKASYRGLATRLARGGAPVAHLAIYKACWYDTRCSNADMLKAFDKGTHDGVEILFVSIGYKLPLSSYNDLSNSIAINSFHATAKEITIVAVVGNSGPISQTVKNTAPRLIIVTTTTIDKVFPTSITLGNNQIFWGQSIDVGKHDHAFAGLTYSKEIALNPTNDSFHDDGLESCGIPCVKVDYEVATQIITYIRRTRQGNMTPHLKIIEPY
ncbi:hypothetical protein UlMin_001666 [Ulmus minor]